MYPVYKKAETSTTRRFGALGRYTGRDRLLKELI